VGPIPAVAVVGGQDTLDGELVGDDGRLAGIRSSREEPVTNLRRHTLVGGMARIREDRDEGLNLRVRGLDDTGLAGLATLDKRGADIPLNITIAGVAGGRVLCPGREAEGEGGDEESGTNAADGVGFHGTLRLYAPPGAIFEMI